MTLSIAYIQRPTPTADDVAVKLMLEDFGHDVKEVTDTALGSSSTWNLLNGQDLIFVRASDTVFDPSRLPSGPAKVFGNRFMFTTWNMTSNQGLGTVVDSSGPILMDAHNEPLIDSGWPNEPDPSDPVQIAAGAGQVLGIPVAQQPTLSNFVVLGYHAGTSLATVAWRPGRVFLGYVSTASVIGANYPTLLQRCLAAASEGLAGWPASIEPPRTPTSEPPDDGAVTPDVGQGNPGLGVIPYPWDLPLLTAVGLSVIRRARLDLGGGAVFEEDGLPVAVGLDVVRRNRIELGDGRVLEGHWWGVLFPPVEGTSRFVQGSASILDRHIRVAGSAVQVERAIRVDGSPVVVVPGA